MVQQSLIQLNYLEICFAGLWLGGVFSEAGNWHEVKGPLHRLDRI